MSGEEDPPPTDDPPAVLTGAAAAVATERQPLRVSMRPPVRYSAGADIELWLTRFELYVRELGIAQNQWTRELLPLLEDEPFRVVTQLGLVHSTDYKAVTTGLWQQFAVEGNELEWQHQLQSHTQRPRERNLLSMQDVCAYLPIRPTLSGLLSSGRRCCGTTSSREFTPLLYNFI